MYITISQGNTSTSAGLVNYLSKEDMSSRDFAEYLTKEDRINAEREGFFNGESARIDKGEVIDGIDSNTRKLSHDETRFYSLTVNPSRKELEHIQSIAYGEALKIEKSAMGQKFWDAEKEITKNLLKEYTVRVMDEYAKNFGRDGLNSNKDLVWYGRVEQERYWKYNDKEVQHNKKIDRQIARVGRSKTLTDIQKQISISTLRGEYILESDVRKAGKDIPVREMLPKNGNNYHIHVVVSRRDKEQQYKLSPLSKARSNASHKMNGQVCKIGFDRNNFAQSAETKFDKTFAYERSWRESLEAYKLARENPELHKERVREEIRQEQQRDKQQKDLSLQRGMERAGVSLLYGVANKAGLQYLEHAQPYIKVASTAIKGINVIRNNTEINRHITSQTKSNYQKLSSLGIKAGKDIARHSIKGITLTPYVQAINIVSKAIDRSKGMEW